MKRLFLIVGFVIVGSVGYTMGPGRDPNPLITAISRYEDPIKFFDLCQSKNVDGDVPLDEIAKAYHVPLAMAFRNLNHTNGDGHKYERSLFFLKTLLQHGATLLRGITLYVEAIPDPRVIETKVMEPKIVKVDEPPPAKSPKISACSLLDIFIDKCKDYNTAEFIALCLWNADHLNRAELRGRLTRTILDRRTEYTCACRLPVPEGQWGARQSTIDAAVHGETVKMYPGDALMEQELAMYPEILSPVALALEHLFDHEDGVTALILASPSMFTQLLQHFCDYGQMKFADGTTWSGPIIEEVDDEKEEEGES